MLPEYERQVRAIEKKYDAQARKGEILFYGASNFYFWKKMEEDLSEYRVQNHGFGGSTDVMLMERAERLLFPYEPKIVVFQTGSNDYVRRSGTDEEKIRACMDYKKEMFSRFHRELPEAVFVVMSGLFLPGHREFTALTQEINRQLAELCDAVPYLYFCDASELTFDGSAYREELFRGDRIHLNHKGQLLWSNHYIRPMLEQLITEYSFSSLKKM